MRVINDVNVDDKQRCGRGMLHNLTMGFTGTQRGMAPLQLKTVQHLLKMVGTIHLGDCIGADAECFAEAKRLGIRTVGHPPEDRRRRAFLVYDEELPPEPYLKRNRAIVIGGKDGIIAAPASFTAPSNLRGQGTWTTVGYARMAHRRLWVVLPDGNAREE